MQRVTSYQNSAGNTAEDLAVLRAVQAVLLDMDGVLYVGNRGLPGVQDLLDYLDATQRRWLCVTNNSSRTSDTFAEKLASMDVKVDPAHILGSAQATANWLAQQVPAGTKVLMMGEKSLRDALASKGFDLIADPMTAEVVVASIFFGLNYEILTDLTLAIRNGARFIATNPDTSLPTERGQVPGTGSLVALLSAASGVTPEFVGKPYPGMYEQAIARVESDPAHTLMVGDRYETDIVGAVELGMPTVGVLTGVSTRAEFESAALPPRYVLADLPELLELFRQADAQG
ncbi:MAG: HAD-IIA family hydrolase [Litorilinea sp.]